MVDAAERNTINLKWAGDKENPLVKVVEEDDPLASEATREEDENSAGLQAFPETGWADGLADLKLMD